MEKEPITVQGLEKIKKELDDLKKIKRPKIVQAIAEARGHGDLKENAEYHAAKEEQSHAEGRITEINDIIARANVIDVTKLNNDGTTSSLNCYFQYILKESIEIPLNQRAVISLNSATVPYSFYNIRQDVNDTIDIKITTTTTGFNYTPTPLILPDGNY